MINDIRSFSEKEFKDTGLKKVYFTYRKYSVIREMGEYRLEGFFRRLGYEIISPEEYTFREQLNILLSCSEFASTIGSVAHNVVFLRENTKVYLIPRSDFITEYQFALDEICDADITFVDSSLSLYTHPAHPWGGPFYFIISDNLLDLFGKKIKRKNNNRGFFVYRQLGFWMNGYHDIGDYYRREYKKYLKMPVEKVEKFSGFFRICQKLHIRRMVAWVLIKLEVVYNHCRRDKR